MTPPLSNILQIEHYFNGRNKWKSFKARSPVELTQLFVYFQEGVKTENEHINLKVAGQDGSVVQFKIKRHTPLSKLMKAYCERQVKFTTCKYDSLQWKKWCSQTLTDKYTTSFTFWQTSFSFNEMLDVILFWLHFELLLICSICINGFISCISNRALTWML